MYINLQRRHITNICAMKTVFQWHTNIKFLDVLTKIDQTSGDMNLISAQWRWKIVYQQSICIIGNTFHVQLHTLSSHFCNNFFIRRYFYQTLLKLSGVFKLQLLHKYSNCNNNKYHWNIILYGKKSVK